MKKKELHENELEAVSGGRVVPIQNPKIPCPFCGKLIEFSTDAGYKCEYCGKAVNKEDNTNKTSRY